VKTLLPALALALVAVVSAADFRRGDIVVAGPWSRPTPPALAVGVVYLSITNHGGSADRLLGASSPRARQVEMHESRRVQGVMQMRPLAAVDCPAGATIKIEPEGIHLMLIGLDSPLLPGSEFPLALRFRDAGELKVRVRVEARE
jgi:hypothetical protein